jgi:hypothetical protein
MRRTFCIVIATIAFTSGANAITDDCKKPGLNYEPVPVKPNSWNWHYNDPKSRCISKYHSEGICENYSSSPDQIVIEIHNQSEDVVNRIKFTGWERGEETEKIAYAQSANNYSGVGISPLSKRTISIDVARNHTSFTSGSLRAEMAYPICLEQFSAKEIKKKAQKAAREKEWGEIFYNCVADKLKSSDKLARVAVQRDNVI